MRRVAELLAHHQDLRAAFARQVFGGSADPVGDHQLAGQIVGAVELLQLRQRNLLQPGARPDGHGGVTALGDAIARACQPSADHLVFDAGEGCGLGGFEGADVAIAHWLGAEGLQHHNVFVGDHKVVHLQRAYVAQHADRVGDGACPVAGSGIARHTVAHDHSRARADTHGVGAAADGEPEALHAPGTCVGGGERRVFIHARKDPRPRRGSRCCPRDPSPRP